MTDRIRAKNLDDDRMIEDGRELFERYRRVAAEPESASRDTKSSPRHPNMARIAIERDAAARAGPLERGRPLTVHRRAEPVAAVCLGHACDVRTPDAAASMA
jgi:hypothetical protein